MPDRSLGADYDLSFVHVHPQDLVSGTVYHMRLVAHNIQFGKSMVKNMCLEQQSVGGPLVLSDGREWELVTPPDAHGARLKPIEEAGVLEASVDGGSFAYLATNPVEVDDAKGLDEEAPVLASRGVTGWSSVDVGLSHNVPIGTFVGFGQEVQVFQ